MSQKQPIKRNGYFMHLFRLHA